MRICLQRDIATAVIQGFRHYRLAAEPAALHVLYPTDHIHELIGVIDQIIGVIGRIALFGPHRVPQQPIPAVTVTRSTVEIGLVCPSSVRPNHILFTAKVVRDPRRSLIVRICYPGPESQIDVPGKRRDMPFGIGSGLLKVAISTEVRLRDDRIARGYPATGHGGLISVVETSVFVLRIELPASARRAARMSESSFRTIPPRRLYPSELR